MIPKTIVGAGRWVVCAVGIGLGACSSSSPSAEPTGGSGSGGSSGGSGGMAGGTGGTGGAGRECVAPQAPSLVLSDAAAVALSISGPDLVFLEQRTTPGTAGVSSIRRVSRDAKDSSLVHSPPADARVTSVIASEDEVYFLETDPASPSRPAFLHRIAKSGGASQRVSAPSSKGYQQLDSELFAVRGGAVYLTNSRGIARVQIADGAETSIAEVGGTPSDAQMVGDTVWYGISHGQFGIFKTPAAAAMPSQTRLGTVTCGPLAFSVTAAGIFCGEPAVIVKWDLEGSAMTSVVDGVELKDSTLAPSLPDGDFVYLGGRGGVLYRLPIQGGAPTVLACNRGAVANVRFDPTDVFWLETRTEADKNVTDIYRLPK